MFGQLFQPVKRHERRHSRTWNRSKLTLERLEVRCLPSTLGGLYSITFAAADPTLYPHVVPSDFHRAPQKRVTKDPLPGADYELLVNGTPTVVGLTSLPASQMTFGQIVPFFFVVSMAPTTPALKNTTITITADWPTTTSSNGSFGYDPAFGVLAAFVDAGDLATVGNSKASATVTWSVLGAGTNNARIEGVFTVTGISSGSTIVVDAWVVLDNSLNGATGDVIAKLVSATAQDGSNIQAGTQTIPLNKVEQIPTTAVTASPMAGRASAPATNERGLAHHGSVSSEMLHLLFGVPGSALDSSF
jgi:hypothetical protein